MHYETTLGVCACDDNAVADGGGCRACAGDEIVVGTACACPPDQTKNADGVCADVPGLGAPCGDASPCPSSVYPVCWEHGDAGSCTKSCTTDADCPDTYACADWEPTPYCRTFTGFGASCTVPEDCASYDASFCIQGQCAVQGCTVGMDDCPRDTKCCDFSSFGIGTLCAPAEYCP